MKKIVRFRPYYLVLFGLFTLFQRSWAQAPVRGLVQEKAGQPLPFATVVLRHLPDSTLSASLTTNEQGVFIFEAVRTGEYCLRVLALGYMPTQTTLRVAQQPVTVPPLRLRPAATALQEVVVQGRPPILEQHADRTVVNVDRLNSAGDNALEVLKKAPGITLDKDDQVVYRGSGSVLVLLDGKQTYLSGEALSTYLKSLPASAISQIELLPNPPASLDAGGTAGVINIRTKRGTRPGLTGTATLGAGYGRYEKASGSTNLAYNRGPMRAFGRLSVGRNSRFNNTIITRLIRDTTFTQQRYWQPRSQVVNYAAGADFALTPHQTLGFQGRGALGQSTAAATSQSTATAPTGQPAGSVALDNPQTGRFTDAALNLNYRLALDTLGRVFTADADWLHYTSADHQDFLPLGTTLATAPGALTGPQRSDQGADVVIRALKADYVHPLPGHWQAEAGAKASWVTTRSAIEFDRLTGPDSWQVDPSRSNQFQYDEAITAGYATLSTTLDRLELKAGLRGEHTHSVGESVTTGQRVARNYFQLFPTVFASYRLGERDLLNFSAGRRISRPSYQSLNPFVTYTDTYTALQGNPFLAPSLARSLVLTFVHRDFQVLGLSYLLETDVVNSLAYQDDQTKVTTTRPQNLDQALTLTLTSGGHTDLNKSWGMDNQLVGSYRQVDTQVGDQLVQLHRVAWSLTSDHTLRLPRQYQLLVGGRYESPSVLGLYYTKATGALSLGARKQLWDGKATLSLQVSDVLNTDRFRATMDYQNVHLTWYNQWESRRALLTFTCKLGSGKTHVTAPRSSTEEETRAGH
ncbi:MAG: outer membrane beta-barrel protein [Janthinobacterium lividum]